MDKKIEMKISWRVLNSNVADQETENFKYVAEPAICTAITDNVNGELSHYAVNEEDDIKWKLTTLEYLEDDESDFAQKFTFEA